MITKEQALQALEMLHSQWAAPHTDVIRAYIEQSVTPSYGTIVDMLPSMLRGGETCPLCGRSGVHEHSPDEIVIYRNGVKYGRSLTGGRIEVSDSDPSCMGAFLRAAPDKQSSAEAVGPQEWCSEDESAVEDAMRRVEQRIKLGVATDAEQWLLWEVRRLRAPQPATAATVDEAKERDAARYRWLRHGDNDDLVLRDNGPTTFLLRNAQLDAAIDAAIKDDATRGEGK